MKDFEIRAYSKKELALAYFPQTMDATTAVRHLMNWIKRCKPLIQSLEENGHRKTSHWFSKREVEQIVYYLGDP